jgi:hypothetical protein
MRRPGAGMKRPWCEIEETDVMKKPERAGMRRRGEETKKN